MINRMDLLERLANGNGAWCATVAAECRKSADFPGLAAMSDADRIFGAPHHHPPQFARLLRH